MKQHLLLLASALVLSLGALAQNTLNLVVFAEDGDLFYAYVNGIKQNDSPQSNVKITGLTSPNISLRIEFNDKALPQLKQNMALEMGYEHTAKIKRDTKKQLKLRYFGQAPLNSTPSNGINTVAYHSTDTPAYNTAPAAGSDNGGTSTTTGGSTITTTQTYNGGAPSVNINMGTTGVSMSVNGMDANGGNVNTVTSTTVSSYSSGSTTSSGYTNSNGDNYSNNTSASQQNATVQKGGCGGAMSPADFDKLKKSVESKPFSDTKMSTARVATKNACMSAAQIKQISSLFNMDDDKLAYAKFAYDYCTDKSNFYQVSEVFSFSSTTDELNKFLEEK